MFNLWLCLSQELCKEQHSASSRRLPAERTSLHLGISCSHCHVCPIADKCYHCVTCASYHLCHACFCSNQVHLLHPFEFRKVWLGQYIVSLTFSVVNNWKDGYGHLEWQAMQCDSTIARLYKLCPYKRSWLPYLPFLISTDLCHSKCYNTCC